MKAIRYRAYYGIGRHEFGGEIVISARELEQTKCSFSAAQSGDLIACEIANGRRPAFYRSATDGGGSFGEKTGVQVVL